jgi:hypothetical protein
VTRIVRFGTGLGVAAAVQLLAAAPALACPVCYGAAGGPWLDGMRLAIFFMFAVTYGLLGGGIAWFVFHRRRLQRQQPSDALEEGAVS